MIQGDIESETDIDTLIDRHGLFDMLISRYVVHELSHPIGTFALWKRALNPAGRLVVIENAWKRTDWGSGAWGNRTDALPLACTQTWATVTYCLKQAGYSAIKPDWMDMLNALPSMREEDKFRLYRVYAW